MDVHSIFRIRLIGSSRLPVPAFFQMEISEGARETENTIGNGIPDVEYELYFVLAYLCNGQNTCRHLYVQTFFISATPPTPEVKTGWTTSDETYTFEDFELFLNQVIPDGSCKDAALPRRLALHHYLDIQGDRGNKTFLVQQYTKVDTVMSHA